MFACVGPVVGAVVLLYLLVNQAIDLRDPANSETGVAVAGVGLPLVMALVIAGAGIVLMVVWRILGPASYWSRRPVAAEAAIHERVDAPPPPAPARSEAVA